MKYLIDTAVFLWMLSGRRDLISTQALDVLDGGGECSLSLVSLWEIAIKYSVGKLELKKNPSRWLPDVILKMGLQPLPISQHHALAVMHLPFHHRDPFDRLLACQSRLEKMPLLTPDAVFKKYRVSVIW